MIKIGQMQNLLVTELWSANEISVCMLYIYWILFAMWILAGIWETPAVRSLQECILLLTGMPEQCMENPQASCFQRYVDGCVTLQVFYLIVPWSSFSPAILRNICRKPHEEPAEATIQLSRLTEKEASFTSFDIRLMASCPWKTHGPHGNHVFFPGETEAKEFLWASCHCHKGRLGRAGIRPKL